MKCSSCGYGGLRINIPMERAEFLSESCGNIQAITSRVDRDRLRRIALRRIALRKEALREGKEAVKGGVS